MSGEESIHRLLQNRYLLGFSDIINAIVRSTTALFVLGLLSLAFAGLALVKDSVAGAVVAAGILVAIAIIAVGGFAIRDRFAGLYEIIEDEDEWDLFDASGEHAVLRKTRKIRFLQDEVFAIRDHAWGSGEVDSMSTYQCNPGVAVDDFWAGERHHVIVSLREIKMRNDVGTYTITRNFKNSYLKESEWISAEIIHPTRSLTLRILFPKSRPPVRPWIKQRSKGNRSQRSITSATLEDGRQVIEKSIPRPRYGDEYTIGWDWPPVDAVDVDS